MEKKIERVPYISRWYKEDDDELLHFDFKDVGSDYDIDKNNTFYNPDYNIYKYYQSNTWTTGYSEPTVHLEYIHHFTHKDIEYLQELIHLIHGDIDAIEHVKSRAKEAHERLYILYDYLINRNGVRDKAQEKQIDDLFESIKPKKSYEGTLGEHWKELMELFRIKGIYRLDYIKAYANGDLEDEYLSKQLCSIKEKLGVDFIKDFIKACEKCEG